MTKIFGEGRSLEKTFSIISPIKNKFSKPDCRVHVFIQKNALDSLWINGYYEIYDFFYKYQNQINQGIIWADQDLKSYSHFFNVFMNKGLPGAEYNALTLAQKYYKCAINYFYRGNIDKSMFYLGAVCHLVQDVNVPQHAMGYLLNNHMQFENYVKANYLKINRFKTYKEPIIFDSIEEYIEYNSLNAIRTEHMYKNIRNLKTKFYLTAEKSLELSHESTCLDFNLPYFF